jgi:hypothetical protein
MYEASPGKADTQQRTQNELIHLNRKLRWMGMEEQARIMQAQLADSRVTAGDNVIGGPAAPAQ